MEYFLMISSLFCDDVPFLQTVLLVIGCEFRVDDVKGDNRAFSSNSSLFSSSLILRLLGNVDNQKLLKHLVFFYSRIIL